MSEEEGANTPPAAGNSAGARRTASRYLTALAHGSAPFISTFLMIHLAAPAMATVGGSGLASQVMIIGREYYQTALGHPLLLVGPLLAHTAAGLAKRIAAPPHTHAHALRPLRSAFAGCGYAAALLLLPVHYRVHRVHPAQARAPVHALAPAELDFEYVKYALQRWPGRSALLYGALAACVLVHAAEGVGVVWNAWVRRAWGPMRVGLRARRVGAAAVVVTVLSGLLALWREPLMAFSSSVARFEGAFAQSFVYRL